MESLIKRAMIDNGVMMIIKRFLTDKSTKSDKIKGNKCSYKTPIM